MSGIIILPVFIIYTVIGFFILKSVLKVFNKKLNTLLLLTIVILLPFWDLFLQKGIKTYYELFLLNPIVYEQPIRDKDGKIESVDFSEWKLYISEENLINKRVYKYIKGISNYMEIYVGNYKNNHDKLVRVYFKTKTFEYITQPTARYIRKSSTTYTYQFFKMVKISKTLIVDREKDKVIMETKSINFTDKFATFRREYLFLIIGGSQRDLFSVSGTSGNYKLFEEMKIDF